jgi:hypothetical protein
MSLLSLVASFAFADPSLTITGTCPGPQSLEISGLTPSATYHVLTGRGAGADTVTAGACLVTTDMKAPKVKLSALSDPSGNAVIDINTSAGSCPGTVEIVDEATCTTSSMATVNTDAHEWFFANYGGAYDKNLEYNGTVSCGGTCAALGLTAHGARFFCNLHGAGDLEGCTKALDYYYGKANCGEMVRDDVKLSENGNHEDCAGGAIVSCVSGWCSEFVTYHALQCQCY